jgi:hypothetical protein
LKFDPISEAEGKQLNLFVTTDFTEVVNLLAKVLHDWPNILKLLLKIL